jgi:cob(I)alamin adenosyltransferase
MEVVKLPPNFIVPGSSPASAAIDLGRSIIRRAERCVVTLKHENQLLNNQIIIYLNRLSDLLFILARYEDRELDFEVVTGENIL